MLGAMRPSAAAAGAAGAVRAGGGASHQHQHQLLLVRRPAQGAVVGKAVAGSGSSSRAKVRMSRVMCDTTQLLTDRYRARPAGE